MDSKTLCKKLFEADSEDRVINILKKEGLRDKSSYRNYYGDNENNFSTIGNQQSSPDTALVEKLINSIDAVLLKECKIKGINPESEDAPNNINKALDKFFNIHHGVLSSIDIEKRRELAENIFILASGKKRTPCYTIIDKGEGQLPEEVPKTFLSLNSSNKLKVPFVQGKFNMGGTGVLQFCGNNNIQLIITKKHPDLIKEDQSNNWSFTIVRRESPAGNRKSSVYTYLTQKNGKLFNFPEEYMSFIPKRDAFGNNEKMNYGSIIKLYNYQIGTLKTLITFDFYYRFSLLIPNIALPVTLLDDRNYQSKSGKNSTIMSGLSVRLEEDKRKKIEENFPSTGEFSVNNQKIKYKIYAFKKDKERNYKRNKEGIIYTVDGQTHGTTPDRIFKRKKVGMDYISSSILIVADCSNFDSRTREDLFMNSRDRLREGDLKESIENNFMEIVKNHKGLKQLKNKRREEDIKNKLGDSKPLNEIVDKLIKKNPSLSKLFNNEGKDLKDPFGLVNTGTKEKFEGKEFPTYFEIKATRHPLQKECPKNKRCRVKFKTDVKNDYFDRDQDAGEFILYLNGERFSEDLYGINLRNGIANLNISIPKESNVGDKLEFHYKVTDGISIEDFEGYFYIIVTKPEEKTKNNNKGEREKPEGKKDGNQKEPDSLSLPNVIEVSKEYWESYGFDEYSALKVVNVEGNLYDYFLNKENTYLLTEFKNNTKEFDVLKEKFKYAMVLVGFSILKSYNNGEMNLDNKEIDIDKYIYETTKSIAPVILPIIDSLGEIDFGENNEEE